MWKKIDSRILAACDINKQRLFITSLLVIYKGCSDSTTESSKKYLKYKKRFELFLTLLDKYKIQGYKISYTKATYAKYYNYDFLWDSYRLKGVITNLEIKWDKDYNPILSDNLIEKYKKWGN